MSGENHSITGKWVFSIDRLAELVSRRSSGKQCWRVHSQQPEKNRQSAQGFRKKSKKKRYTLSRPPRRHFFRTKVRRKRADAQTLAHSNSSRPRVRIDDISRKCPPMLTNSSDFFCDYKVRKNDRWQYPKQADLFGEKKGLRCLPTLSHCLGARCCAP